MSFTKHELIREQMKFDVFNALTLQDNNLFLSDLKVGSSTLPAIFADPLL